MEYLGIEQNVEIKKYCTRTIEYLRCDKCKKIIYPQECLGDTDESKYIEIRYWDDIDFINTKEKLQLCPDCACDYFADFLDNATDREHFEAEPCCLVKDKVVMNDYSTNEYKLAENDDLPKD